MTKFQVTLTSFFQLVTEKSDLYASACAIGRSYPMYNRKANKRKKNILVEFVLVGEGTHACRSFINPTVNA